MLVDLVLVYGMMVYQDYAITTSGGVDNITTLCQKRNILLPTWAPPCCLLPFINNHYITTKIIKSITSFPAVLDSLKLTIIIFYMISILTNMRMDFCSCDYHHHLLLHHVQHHHGGRHDWEQDKTPWYLLAH